ncbi:MAG: 50S ribosomal protein L3, partial [Armatimonadota bacterium]|nr:50S ribosomal protein L3 [Armatimonadota bacterium]
QLFDDRGNIVPVTVVEAGPCVVTQIRTPERDGYSAVQLGFETVSERRVTRAMKGHFARAKVAPRRVLREFPVEEDETFTVGQEVTVGAFDRGDIVDVVGTTKGRGFSGAMKRHNFRGQRDTHGVSLMHRAVGSLGISDVGRVWPGKRMPGRYGGERVSVRGLQVVGVDASRNLLLLKGALPGPRGGLVLIRRRTPARTKR